MQIMLVLVIRACHTLPSTLLIIFYRPVYLFFLSLSGIVYDTFQGELTVRTEKEVDEEIYGTVQIC